MFLTAVIFVAIQGMCALTISNQLYKPFVNSHTMLIPYSLLNDIRHKGEEISYVYFFRFETSFVCRTA